jgi:hypothetical protein
VVIKRKFFLFLDAAVAHQTRRALAGLMFQELFSGERQQPLKALSTRERHEGSFAAGGTVRDVLDDHASIRRVAI